MGVHGLLLPRLPVLPPLGRSIDIEWRISTIRAIRRYSHKLLVHAKYASRDHRESHNQQPDGTNDFALEIGPPSLNDACCLWQRPISEERKIKDTKAEVSQETTTIHVKSSYLFNMRKLAVLAGSFSLLDDNYSLASTSIEDLRQSFTWLGDVGDISTGFTSAFLLILFSELGDKTFFIAALLASQKSTTAVFIGAFGALTIMTVLSVLLGRTFHYLDGILPFRPGEDELPIDDLVAAGLLVFFGVSTLVEASSNDEEESANEQEKAELAIAGFSADGAGILAIANTIISTFTLVFLAEWGDKSFFSTIALAASSSPLGVVGGAVAGHGIATLIAVLGGSFLGKYVPEKVVAYTGGILFLVFAAITLYEIFT